MYQNVNMLLHTQFPLFRNNVGWKIEEFRPILFIKYLFSIKGHAHVPFQEVSTLIKYDSQTTPDVQL